MRHVYPSTPPVKSLYSEVRDRVPLYGPAGRYSIYGGVAQAGMPIIDVDELADGEPIWSGDIAPIRPKRKEHSQMSPSRNYSVADNRRSLWGSTLHERMLMYPWIYRFPTPRTFT